MDFLRLSQELVWSVESSRILLEQITSLEENQPKIELSFLDKTLFQIHKFQFIQEINFHYLTEIKNGFVFDQQNLFEIL